MMDAIEDYPISSPISSNHRLRAGSKVSDLGRETEEGAHVTDGLGSDGRYV